MMARLPRSFYDRDTLIVARELLGQRLVRTDRATGQVLSGLITETEAYRGPDDQASHAFRRTSRSAIMYGPPGQAYVYFIYGSQHCLNVVTEAEGQAGAVLIRAIIPGQGQDAMRARRGPVPDRRLTDGPGKLCQALAIDRALNGADLTESLDLHIEVGPGAPDDQVAMTPRIGVHGDEETRLRPWRYVWKMTGL